MLLARERYDDKLEGNILRYPVIQYTILVRCFIVPQEIPPNGNIVIDEYPMLPYSSNKAITNPNRCSCVAIELHCSPHEQQHDVDILLLADC